jgi:hypothetical protein
MWGRRWVGRYEVPSRYPVSLVYPQDGIGPEDLDPSHPVSLVWPQERDQVVVRLPDALRPPEPLRGSGWPAGEARLSPGVSGTAVPAELAS